MKKKHMSLKECKKIINDFAIKWKLIFEEEGECGFGRECVGLTNGNNYVDYNPQIEISDGYKYVDGFYNEIFDTIKPEDAYHKHNCLAVLGRGEGAIRQLSEWVTSLNKLGVVVEEYKTGATGLQALLTGTENYAVKIKSKTNGKN